MPSRGRLDRLTLAADADLTTTTVEGRDERDVSVGGEAWLLGRRVGVRGGAGRNTVETGGSFGALGLSVAPYSRVYIEASMTRGESGARDRWGIDLRVTF
jgi:hypothetical protein